LSYTMWQDQFGGAQDIVGQTISINSEPYTVVGVAPSGFKGTHLLASPDLVWIPASMYSQIFAPPTNDLFNRRYRQFEVIGRLNPQVSVAQAQESLRAIAKELEREHPWENPAASADAVPLSEATLGNLSRDRVLLATFALGAVSGLILLIACL